MRNVGRGLLIAGVVCAVAWAYFHFWVEPPIKDSYALMSGPKKFPPTFSSDDERTGFGRAMEGLKASIKTERWTRDEAGERLHGCILRVSLCHASQIDPLVRSKDLPSEVVRHFERYCKAVSEIQWTDYRGMATEVAILRMDVDAEVAPSSRNLIRSSQRVLYSRVLAVIALLASIGGLVVILLDVRERLDTSRKT